MRPRLRYSTDADTDCNGITLGESSGYTPGTYIITDGGGPRTVQAVGGGDLVRTVDTWYKIVVDFNVPGQTYELNITSEDGTLLAKETGSVDSPMAKVDGFTMYNNTTGAGASGVGQQGLAHMVVDNVRFDSEPPVTCEEMLAAVGAITGDVNEDCYVDMADFKIMADTWLDCIIPGVGGCDSPWTE